MGQAGGERSDPAKELLPPLDDFLRDVDKLASSLGKVLHIPEGALDRSVESLDAVHKAVGRVRIAKRMTPEVFTPLTAYLGEVMRLVCDGRWGRLPAAIKKRFRRIRPGRAEALYGGTGCSRAGRVGGGGESLHGREGAARERVPRGPGAGGGAPRDHAGPQHARAETHPLQGVRRASSGATSTSP